jgi:hypothetical protein
MITRNQRAIAAAAAAATAAKTTTYTPSPVHSNPYPRHSTSEFTPAFFDESSAAWLANKRKCINCTYKYRCDQVTQTGKRCNRDVYKTESLCRQHWALAAEAEKKKRAIPKQETIEWSATTQA